MAISTELFYFFLHAPSSIPHTAKEVTPSDVNELDITANGKNLAAHAIYVGDTSLGGDITVVTLDDREVTFSNAIEGQILDTGFIKQIKATGTTAASLVVLYNVTNKRP